MALIGVGGGGGGLQHTPLVVFLQSKGGILAKACDYIQELRSINARLMGSAERADHSSVDVDMLTNQMLLLKKQNSLLRSFILQKGLQIPAELLTDGLL